LTEETKVLYSLKRYRGRLSHNISIFIDRGNKSFKKKQCMEITS